MITPEEVADGIADAAEVPQLRIPLGQPASQILAARRASPDDRLFTPAHPPPSGRQPQGATKEESLPVLYRAASFATAVSVTGAALWAIAAPTPNYPLYAATWNLARG